MSMLILEALAPRRRMAHAIRLLDVVAMIGRAVSAHDWMLLCSGGNSRNPLIRAKCTEVLGRLGSAVADLGDGYESRRHLKHPVIHYWSSRWPRWGFGS